MDILKDIFELCIVPLLAVLTAYFVAFIKKKTAEIEAKEDNELKAKYIEMLSQTIQEAVVSTNQEYVDSLKAKGEFTPEAQEEAFRKTYEKVTLILTEDARKYLAEVYSDLDKYITTKIEAEVRNSKNEVQGVVQ